jgi:hypothetical protein
LGLALRDTRFNSDLGVKVSGLQPKFSGFFVGAGCGFYERKAAEGVCHIAGWGLRMAAVNCEGLNVAGLGEFKFAPIAEYVSLMADGVREA